MELIHSLALKIRESNYGQKNQDFWIQTKEINATQGPKSFKQSVLNNHARGHFEIDWEEQLL